MIPGFTFVDHFAGNSARGAQGDGRRLTEWSGVDSLPDRIRADLAREIGRPIAVRPPNRNPPSPVIGARIAMIESVSRRVLSVSVAIGVGTARALVSNTLGAAADTDTVAGFAAELSNLAAGAVKRWSPADVDLTFGLPKVFEGALPPAFADLTFDMVDGPIVLRCMLHLKPASISSLSVRSLEEGMVLARDVRSETGARLLFGGQRLTRSAIDVLRSGPGENLRFDVIEGA